MPRNSIRTRLGRHVHLGDGAAVLGIEDPRDDVELLQRVDRRQQHVGVEVQVGVLDAVERVVVEVDALAGHVQRKAVALAAHALFALARRRPVGGGAGNQRRQLQVVAAVERQLDDRAVFDNRADGGVLRLDQWRLTHDGHASRATSPTSIVKAIRLALPTCTTRPCRSMVRKPASSAFKS